MDFESFYKNTFKAVYRYFYYKSVTKSSIEDLSHDVYFRFFNKYSNTNISEIESTKILFGYCKNIYKEWVRKSIKDGNVTYIDDIEYEYIDDETDRDINDLLSDDYEKQRLKDKEALLNALSSLSSNIRLVLEYRFLKGMSRKEISDKLNISQKDVHTYQKRGIKYLRKLINKKGVPL